MNKFRTTSMDERPNHVESMLSNLFQSLFPPLSPSTTPLNQIRRVLLLNREIEEKGAALFSKSCSTVNHESFIFNLRHYAITTKATDVPKLIKRVNNAEKRNTVGKKKGRGLPNLGKLTDVSDYLLDPNGAGEGYTSVSETEIDSEAEVEVVATTKRKVTHRRAAAGAERESTTASERLVGDVEDEDVEKRAVKLTELGPRLCLRLVKIEEGLCGGKVMWHGIEKKSAAEERQLEQELERKRAEKEERKRIQRENVQRKTGNVAVNADDGPEDEVSSELDSWGSGVGSEDENASDMSASIEDDEDGMDLESEGSDGGVELEREYEVDEGFDDMED